MNLSVQSLVEQIRKGDRRALAKGITLLESGLEEDKKKGEEVLESLLGDTGKAWRIGVSGSPGVGKSTLIEGFGQFLVEKGKKLAVLAIDPTSSLTGGSLLGDEARMEKLSANPDVFIRPSPSGMGIGGVSLTTREVVLLCEAAGYDVILIETVGAGQVDTMVHSMADFFLLMVQPNAGDELQGMKKGIVELADAIFVTKADQAKRVASQTQRFYQRSLEIYGVDPFGWTPKVLLGSGLEALGFDKLYHTLETFFEKANWPEKRKGQRVFWFEQTLKKEWERLLEGSGNYSKQIKKLRREVREKNLTPYSAVSILLKGIHLD